MPGRPFAFIFLICGGWTAARLAVGMHAVPGPSHKQPTSSPASIAVAISDPAAMTSPLANAAYVTLLDPVTRKIAVIGKGTPQAAIGTKPAFLPPTMVTALPIAMSATRLTPPLLPNPQRPGNSKPISFYLYSFWRWPGGIGGLAPTGQYGGSQSGMIATIDAGIFSKKFADRGLSLLIRAAFVPQRKAQQEGALGLRWKPVRKWPVTLSAEQRFYSNGASRSAAYAAGGVDEVKLPARVKLDAYGQAGFVSGKGGGPFFDLASHAMRPVANIGPVQVQAGAGVWAGGQRDLTRLDVGPSLRTNIKIGATNLRLDADWRFRVAGNARPASGPALTLSTSF